MHVEDLVWDPEAPIDLTIDPGYYPSRYAALAIQPMIDDEGREVVCVVDEIWVNHWTHHDVIAECQKRPWWPNVYTVWGGHETRQHAAAKSTEEVWRELTGLPFEIVDRALDKKQNIMRMKTMLTDPGDKAPRLFINTTCAGLLYEFPRYERRTNRVGDVISDDPDRMAEDDALDALTNYLVGRFGLVDVQPREPRHGRRNSPARG